MKMSGTELLSLQVTIQGKSEQDRKQIDDMVGNIIETISLNQSNGELALCMVVANLQGNGVTI